MTKEKQSKAQAVRTYLAEHKDATPQNVVEPNILRRDDRQKWCSRAKGL